MSQPAPAAFSDLYRDHSAAVYRFALYLCGNAAWAEDILAETFLRIWTSAAPVQLGTVRAYLLTIARNIHLQERRKAWRAAAMPEDVAAPGNLEHITWTRLELDRVMASLAKLREIDRAALLMRAAEGLSYDEIGAALGLTAAAVRLKVHRVRLRLAEERERSKCDVNR